MKSDFRLRVFISVAKNLSFTKASKELFVSQPAITKHIHELETEYQTSLFNRMGNKISLTEAGKLLLTHSESILEAYRRLKYDMNLLNNKYNGELRLGASTTIAQYVLPEILAKFNERYPQIKVSLLDANSRNIEQALVNHDIDLGLVEGVIRIPEIRYEDFLSDEIVAVARTDSSLPEEIPLHSLHEIPLVLREYGSGTLDVIEQALLAHKIKLSDLHIKLQLGSTESIKSYLRHSPNCLGLVSILSITRELQNGTFRIVEIEGDFIMKRQFSLAFNQGSEIPQVANFANFIRNRLKKKKAEV